MLNEMRFGQLSQRTIETFSNMSRPVQYPDGLEPTVRLPLAGDLRSSA